MNEVLISKLKTACNQFYMNKEMDKPLMSDNEFDELRKQYESEYKKSVKELVDWESELSIDNDPEKPLEKEIIYDNDLKHAMEEKIKSIKNDFIYFNLKYDGGGIKAIYNESGILQRIQSTPDEDYGIIRTEQFWNLFPHHINPEWGVKSLRGEVLVDPIVYGKTARNKANGLINSTVNKDEITKEAFIRIYRIAFHDNKWDLDRQMKVLSKLPTIRLLRNRCKTANSDEVELKNDLVFSSAYMFGLDEIPSTAIAEQKNGDIFQCDGIVMYSALEGIKGFKFYYTDSAITKIKDITWNQKPNGSFAAVCELDPVWLDDKYISRASSNGVANLIDMQLGVGAEVKVILANTTIPKIIEVIKPSTDFKFPKCSCGYQMSEKDIYGSTLKCGNTNVCTHKMNLWMPEVAGWFTGDERFIDCKWLEECIRVDPVYIGWVLHIDRWNPDNRFEESFDKDVLSEGFIDCILNDDLDGFRELIIQAFYFTELQLNILDINIATAFEVLIRLFNLNWDDMKAIAS